MSIISSDPLHTIVVHSDLLLVQKLLELSRWQERWEERKAATSHDHDCHGLTSLQPWCWQPLAATCTTHTYRPFTRTILILVTSARWKGNCTLEQKWDFTIHTTSKSFRLQPFRMVSSLSCRTTLQSFPPPSTPWVGSIYTPRWSSRLPIEATLTLWTQGAYRAKSALR